jgi:hypothetical protein
MNPPGGRRPAWPGPAWWWIPAWRFRAWPRSHRPGRRAAPAAGGGRPRSWYQPVGVCPPGCAWTAGGRRGSSSVLLPVAANPGPRSRPTVMGQPRCEASTVARAAAASVARASSPPVPLAASVTVPMAPWRDHSRTATGTALEGLRQAPAVSPGPHPLAGFGGGVQQRQGSRSGSRPRDLSRERGVSTARPGLVRRTGMRGQAGGARRTAQQSMA